MKNLAALNFVSSIQMQKVIRKWAGLADASAAAGLRYWCGPDL